MLGYFDKVYVNPYVGETVLKGLIMSLQCDN